MTVSKEQFIQRAKKAHEIHGASYIYDDILWCNMSTKVKITCVRHGEFMVRPQDHIFKLSGCRSCGYERNSKNFKMSVEEVKEKIKNVHGDLYGLDGIVDYENNKSKIELFCHVHGVFKTDLNHIITRGDGCPSCGLESRTNASKRSIVDLNAQIKSKWVNLKVTEHDTMKEKSKFHCGECDSIFESQFHNVVRCGCSKCKGSIRERKTHQFLKSISIDFTREWSHNECRGLKRPLPFDFYIPSRNMVIEIDGRHHFEPVTFNGQSEESAHKSFEKTKEMDRIKNDFCSNTGIEMVRIPYFENLEEHLMRIFGE